MTELEAYVLRLEKELAECNDMIDQIERDRLPEADELEVKEQLLNYETTKRDGLVYHIANMKKKLGIKI